MELLSDRVNGKWNEIVRDLVAVMALKFKFVLDVEKGACCRS